MTDQSKKTALLVVDMQVKGGKAIVQNVITAVAVARKKGILVVWVVREHYPTGRDVELFRRHFYNSGTGLAVKGSKGAELVDGLVIEEGDLCMDYALNS